MFMCACVWEKEKGAGVGQRTRREGGRGEKVRSDGKEFFLQSARKWTPRVCEDK